ncbi:hypothetical protein KCU91_g10657, partial [Aureobasidium melanogenum]
MNSGTRSHRYTDATVSETITVCAEFGLIDVIRVLSFAFKDNLTEKALQSLRALKDTMDLSLPEDRTRLKFIFGKVVLGHKSVSKKYDVLSFLLGAEALDVQNQEDCMPELRAWVTGILDSMFADLDSLTSEDGGVIARIATSDTSGTLLRDRIMPNIERQMQGSDPAKTTFMTAFLVNMFERSEPLNDNLVPVDRVKRVRVSKQRQHHLHTHLDAYTDCTHITEHGYIETMVVTKQGKSFEEKLKTWTSKAKSALAALRSLEDQEATLSSPSQLRNLLGNKYADIMALRIVRIMTAAQQQPIQPARTAASSSTSNAATAGASTSTATQPAMPQVAGRKRKAVVIDLTDD